MSDQVKIENNVEENQIIPGKVLTWNELPQFIRDALQKVANDEGFLTPTFTLSSGSNVGDGFVSMMLRVVIEGYKVKSSLVNKGVKQQLRVIAKLAPLSKARREAFGANNLFEREVQMYNEYLPVLEKYQIDKGISRREGLYSSPRCYFASFDRKRDETVLILEDLGEHEFSMWSKFVPMDYFHASKVMESLGRFHGLSMVLKKQKPEVFKKFKEYKDAMTPMVDTEQLKQMFMNYFDSAIKAFSETETDTNTVAVDTLKYFRDNFAEEIKKIMDPDRAEPYTVINHGDCWINNFMFKKGNGFQPSIMAFIDYQIARYVSPVLDLVYFLFTSTDKQLRDEHFEDLLSIYHSSFSAIVRRCDENVDELFPYEALQQQLKKFARFGLPMALMILPMLTMTAQDIPDLDQATEAMTQENMESSPEFKEMMEKFQETAKRAHQRIKDVVTDMIDYGYL